MNQLIRQYPGRWLAALLFLLIIVTVSLAQPVKTRILEDVSVEQAGQDVVLTVEFSFPVRYLRHFPDQQGTSLEIALQAISISDIDNSLLARRESMRVPRDLKEQLVDISYEGDLPGGPFLSLRFFEETRFSVRQGADFRSIAVTLKGVGDANSE